MALQGLIRKWERDCPGLSEKQWLGACGSGRTSAGGEWVGAGVGTGRPSPGSGDMGAPEPGVPVRDASAGSWHQKCILALTPAQWWSQGQQRPRGCLKLPSMQCHPPSETAAGSPAPCAHAPAPPPRQPRTPSVVASRLCSCSWVWLGPSPSLLSLRSALQPRSPPGSLCVGDHCGTVCCASVQGPLGLFLLMNFRLYLFS